MEDQRAPNPRLMRTFGNTKSKRSNGKCRKSEDRLDEYKATLAQARKMAATRRDAPNQSGRGL